jgi:hypothetical protein
LSRKPVLKLDGESVQRRLPVLDAGIVHFLLMLRSASQKILKTASSWGKAPLALVTLREGVRNFV